MNIWIPAITSSSVLAILLWLGRALIITRLTAAVQHEFDKKIEELRNSFKMSEEILKAELRSKETQIQALQSGALSGLAHRQVAINNKRIESAAILWSAVIDLTPGKFASTLLSGFDFEKMSIEAVANPKFRQVFEVMGGSIDLQKIANKDVPKIRPFVSQISWALFSAYQAIVMLAVTRLHILKNGMGTVDFFDKDVITKLISVALPHHADNLKKYGDKVYHILLDELENRILEEIQNTLQGKESDKATIEQAAAIIDEAAKVTGSLQSQKAP